MPKYQGETLTAGHLVGQQLVESVPALEMPQEMPN